MPNVFCISANACVSEHAEDSATCLGRRDAAHQIADGAGHSFARFCLVKAACVLDSENPTEDRISQGVSAQAVRHLSTELCGSERSARIGYHPGHPCGKSLPSAGGHGHQPGGRAKDGVGNAADGGCRAHECKNAYQAGGPFGYRVAVVGYIVNCLLDVRQGIFDGIPNTFHRTAQHGHYALCQPGQVGQAVGNAVHHVDAQHRQFLLDRQEVVAQRNHEARHGVAEHLIKALCCVGLDDQLFLHAAHPVGAVGVIQELNNKLRVLCHLCSSLHRPSAKQVVDGGKALVLRQLSDRLKYADERIRRKAVAVLVHRLHGLCDLYSIHTEAIPCPGHAIRSTCAHSQVGVDVLDTGSRSGRIHAH